MNEATEEKKRIWSLNVNIYKDEWVTQQVKNRDDESTVKKLDVKMVRKTYKDPISGVVTYKNEYISVV